MYLELIEYSSLICIQNKTTLEQRLRLRDRLLYRYLSLTSLLGHNLNRFHITFALNRCNTSN